MWNVRLLLCTLWSTSVKSPQYRKKKLSIIPISSILTKKCLILELKYCPMSPLFDIYTNSPIFHRKLSKSIFIAHRPHRSIETLYFYISWFKWQKGSFSNAICWLLKLTTQSIYYILIPFLGGNWQRGFSFPFHVSSRATESVLHFYKHYYKHTILMLNC